MRENGDFETLAEAVLALADILDTLNNEGFTVGAKVLRAYVKENDTSVPINIVKTGQVYH